GNACTRQHLRWRVESISPCRSTMIVTEGHELQSATLLLQELSLLQRVSQVLSSIAQEHDAPLAVAWEDGRGQSKTSREVGEIRIGRGLKLIEVDLLLNRLFDERVASYRDDSY